MEQSSALQPQSEAKEDFKLTPANFPGDERIHISINVTDLFDSVNFYRVFFGIDPIKIREGYAKFDVQEPPLNFSVNENPLDTRTQGHLGIQVKSTRIVKETYARLLKAGFKILTEDGAECCYAVQTKMWVADPDGNRWEVFCTTVPDAVQGCGEDCICHQEFERSYAE